MHHLEALDVFYLPYSHESANLKFRTLIYDHVNKSKDLASFYSMFCVLV
jgi:hypothetical protein